MTPIQRSIEFASKFPDIITDKTQLQRFLKSLNYISPFYKNLSRDLALLYDRLKKDHKKLWTNSLTDLVKTIKERVKYLPCLTLANLAWPKIVETDVSNIGYGGKWSDAQKKYATVAHEMLTIVKCRFKVSSSIHLEDISESDPLYAKLHEFLTQKQGDYFASIAKEEVDDIKTYEKRKEEPWKIFQRYLVNGLYFPGEQNEMIMKYLEEVKKKILLNVSNYAKSDSSMCSETSEDMHEAQPYEEDTLVDALKKAEDFLAKLKDKM
ncbi:hypothetical protein H5410_047451 [Solanum commersonii]|uniref:Uncharacterized protein n=1 Tax=Solanum commersonii TaxID=4109 RepID=A0A9J5XF58_SOLCO|nr:hypothetical protein H5410_047451 [Solanum commersonii]